jgi:hypothetical protein
VPGGLLVCTSQPAGCEGIRAGLLGLPNNQLRCGWGSILIRGTGPGPWTRARSRPWCCARIGGAAPWRGRAVIGRAGARRGIDIRAACALVSIVLVTRAAFLFTTDERQRGTEHQDHFFHTC